MARRGADAPNKPHYLPHNKITWTPPAVIFLRVATKEVPGAEIETLQMASWVAQLILRRDIKPAHPDRRLGTGATPAELATWVGDVTRGRETVWLFTHNAALDLVTSRLPLELHRAGWSVNDASLSGSAPWLRLGKGSRRLAIVDSFSWLPHTAPDLADRLGLPPLGHVSGETATERNERSARHDLATVGDAMLNLLDWWDKHGLGKWAVSGSSSGFHAMRHIENPHKLVIDPDPARTAGDRAAIYGGRRGAWVVGTRSLGPFLELDFANAYPGVAAGLPLPTRRGAAFSSMALDNWRLTSDRWGIIANVVLRTDRARWPVRFPGGTFCPTGEFATTLCGPEIRDALQLGALLRVDSGITHQLGPYLQPWGKWVIDQVRNADGDTPIEAQIAAKSWSRSTIGKFAARGYERIDLGASPELGWHYEEGWDHGTQTRFGTVHLAGEQWQSVVSGDAEQAYPGIFAWVESYTRSRLSAVIDAIGEGAILQCDTDGLIVSERLLGMVAARGHLVAPAGYSGAMRTRWVLDQLAPLTAPLNLRIKKTHRQVRVLGPQHVNTPGDRKYAGLPKLAVEGKPDVFTFKQWPGLPYQLSSGATAGYVRPEATVRINGPYAPGWVLTDGRVIAPECRIDDRGSNRLLGWAAMTLKPDGARLAAEQHPVLAALW